MVFRSLLGIYVFHHLLTTNSRRMASSFFCRQSLLYLHKPVRYSVLFFLFPIVSFGQNNTYKHPTLLGVHFLINDFGLQAPWLPTPNRDAGIGVSYLKGINRFLDWTIHVNASFSDSAIKQVNSIKEKRLLISSDFSLRGTVLDRHQWFHPYLLAGVGISTYAEKVSTYSLFGPGLQVNYKEVYLLTNAQYRLPVNGPVNKHFYYNIGISGIIGKPAKKKALKSPLPIPAKVATDRDKDGIVDTFDSCPDEPGLAIFLGCPDRDHDNIEDKSDYCPSVYGFEKYKGCPVPDRDKDGINDEEDKCIEMPGTIKYAGCPIPDIDGDGVNDEEDECIMTPGKKENKGCPEVESELTDHLNIAAKNVFFKTGSYNLLPKSFSSLDRVVNLLTKHPDFTLLIEGHTDNSGTLLSNQLLSEKRALSVMEYLSSKGINGTRLKAIGYGQQRPITENHTMEGKEKNRRVELKILR